MKKHEARLIEGGFADVYIASEVDEVQAHRLRAESSPEALESERQANAILTERIADLELAARENARYSTEMREEFERRGSDYEHEKIMRLQCEERIAELEQQLAGANASIALFMGPDGEQHINRFADAVRSLMER